MHEAESLPQSSRALWAALSAMRLPPAGDQPSFVAALQEATGWTPPFAERAVGEYRRFLFLAATSSRELTPSRAVDEVWHLHLETPHYEEELCGRILGRPLRHLPGSGKQEDEARFQRQYAATLRLYEDLFADPPPRDVWPSAIEPAKRRRPRSSRGMPLASSIKRFFLGVGALIILGSGVGAAPAVTVALLGIAFLLVLVLSEMGAAPSRRAGGQSGGEGGCGADFGGGDGHAGCAGHGGCGGSCGGGACGGGCGGS